MRKFFIQIFLKLFIITFIPVIITNFYFYKISKETVEKNVEKILSTKLDFEQKSIAKTLSFVESDLKNLITLLNSNISHYQDIIKKIFYNSKIFTEILLLNKDFKIIDGISKFNSILLHPPLNIKKYVKFSIKYTSNDVQLIIMEPVTFKNYEFNNIAYVYAAVSLKNIFNEFAYKTSDNYQYFILDKNGNLIFHSNYNYVIAGKNYKNVLKEFQKYPLHIDVKLFNPITGKKELYLITIKSVSSTIPLYIGVEILANKAFAQMDAVKDNIIFEAIALIILMWLISIFIANSIVVPIKRLQEASQKITNGNFNINLQNLPENEIGILGHNIERMAQTIKKDIDTIKFQRDKLNRLFNSINDGIYVVDLDYNITMINSKELEFVNINREDAINKKCYKVFAKRNSPCENCMIGKEENITLLNIDINKYGFRKNCKRKFVNMSFIKFSEKEYLIYLYDITELVESLDKIKQEKEKLKITLESIGDAVIVTDNKGEITLINKVALTLTGFSVEEAIGNNINNVFKIIDEKSGEKLPSPVEKVLIEKKVVTISNHALLISKNGKKINIEDSAAPIFDESKNLLGVVLVFRDVTEKLKAEKEIQKIEKLQTIGQLAAGIAHDFNNILTGVYGNISLAKLFINNEEKLSKLLDKAEKSLDKAKGLTTQLLTFAKGGSPVKEISSIESIIKESVDFALIGTNIKINYHFPDKIWKVHVDPVQISQVFNNLALNAKDAMKDGGELNITLENIEIKEFHGEILSPGKYVKITFEDNGEGIDKEILPNIFNPFFTTKEKGSGLGLATSYSIIKNHDGYIEVFSEKGKGTSFFIYLPAVEKEKISKHEIKEETISSDPSPLNILIMDDSEDILESAKELFTFLGHKVATAKNGEEAIEMYKKSIEKGEKFDIVIMDLTIKGGMGGKEAIKLLLEIDENINAVVSSGYSDDLVMANYRDYGFKYALSKPYTFKEVKKMLREINA